MPTHVVKSLGHAVVFFFPPLVETSLVLLRQSAATDKGTFPTVACVGKKARCGYTVQRSASGAADLGISADRLLRRSEVPTVWRHRVETLRGLSEPRVDIDQRSRAARLRLERELAHISPVPPEVVIGPPLASRPYPGQSPVQTLSEPRSSWPDPGQE
jgi:hypothetical protein